MNAAVHTSTRVHRCRDDVRGGPAAIAQAFTIGGRLELEASAMSVPITMHHATSTTGIGIANQTVRRRRERISGDSLVPDIDSPRSC